MLNASSLLVAMAAMAPLAAAAQGFVGAETCKACHAAAYDAWRDGPHARALERLPEASRRDARCTSCHAPPAEAGAQGVTCEVCHGPGRAYAQAFVMRDRELARAVGLADPGERTCAACHTEATPSLRPFHYAEKLPLIQHGGPAPRAAGDVPPPAGRRR